METINDEVNKEFDKASTELNSLSENNIKEEKVQKVLVDDTHNIYKKLNEETQSKLSATDLQNIAMAMKQVETEQKIRENKENQRKKAEEDQLKKTAELEAKDKINSEKLKAREQYIVRDVIKNELLRFKEKYNFEFYPQFKNMFLDATVSKFKLIEENGEDKIVHNNNNQNVSDFLMDYHKNNKDQFKEIVEGIGDVEVDAYKDASSVENENSELMNDPRKNDVVSLAGFNNFFKTIEGGNA